jgi:hypothetical protein
MTPIPYESSSVYMKSEKIDVTFDDEYANVKAYYTFFNDGVSDTELDILLPFRTKPSDLELYQDDIKITFYWGGSEANSEKIFNEVLDERPVENIPIAFFSINIQPHDTTTVYAKYKRDYITYDAPELGNEEIFYNFVYITGTARYWNHSIEKAEFIFRVPEDLTDGEKSFHKDVTLENGYYVSRITYEDWNIGEEDRVGIFFEWKRDRPWTQDIFTTTGFIWLNIFALVIGLTLAIIIIIKRRKKKMGNN